MSIESLKQQARKHEQNEEWLKALEQYDKALAELAREEQVDIGLYNRVGDLYVRVGKVEPAVEHYEKAVELYREAYLPNNAIAVCKKIIRNVPERHRAYLVIGQIRAEQGFIPDARTNFLTYAERMQQAGDLTESFRALIEFCDLAPDDIGVRMTVAEQMASQGMVDEAVEQLLIVRGHYETLGDHQKVEDLATRILHLKPDADLTAGAAGPSSVSSDGEIMADFGEIGISDDAFSLGSDEEVSIGLEGAMEEAAAETGDVGTDFGGFEIAASADEADTADADGATGDDDAFELPMMDLGDDGAEEATPLPTFGDDGGADAGDVSSGSGDVELPGMDFEVDTSASDVMESASETLESTAESFEATLESGAADLESSFESAADELPLMDVDLPDDEGTPDPLPGFDDEPVSIPTIDFGGDAGDDEASTETDDAAPAMGLEDAFDAVAGTLGDVEDEVSSALEGAVEDAQDELSDLAEDASEVVSDALPGLPEPTLSTGQSDVVLPDPVVPVAPPEPEPVVEATPEPTPPAPAPPEPAAPPEPESKPADDGGFVDLGAMILGDTQEKSTRFTVAYEEPSGDEQADFAKMLSQFKDKVSENLEASDVRAHYDLGTAYKEMGLLDEAIGSFQAALRASSDHLPTYELMGQTFIEMGQPEAAVRSLERALQAANTVDDELVGIYYYLGRAYEELGNSGSAVEYYDRVFSLDINFADVTERLRELR